MQKRKFIYLTSLLAFLIVSGAYGAINHTTPNMSTSQTGTPVKHYYVYQKTFANNTLDGKVTPGEYPNVFNVSAVGGYQFAQVYMVHDATRLKVAVVAKLAGWVGFGLSENGMINATIFETGVVGSNTSSPGLFKGLLTGNVFPGFVRSLSNAEIRGVQVGNNTTIELVIPLKSPDGFYNMKINQTYGFIVAGHKTSDVLEYHSYHSQRNLRFTLLPASQPAPVDVSLTGLTVTKGLNGSYDFQVSMNTLTQNVTVSFVAKSFYGEFFIGSIDSSGGTIKFAGSMNFTTYSQVKVYAMTDNLVGFNAAKSNTVEISGLTPHFYEIYVHHIVEDPNWNNTKEFVVNPNMFQNSGHLISAAMLWTFVLVVTLVLWEYGAAVMKLIYLHILGNEEELKKE